MSLANYIVICKGRIRLGTAKSVGDKLRAASDAATELVKHIDTMHEGQLTTADTKPISDLQHYMMDNMDKMRADEADQKVTEMFALLDALEEKFEHHEY